MIRILSSSRKNVKEFPEKLHAERLFYDNNAV